jgi:membrane protein YdbS with pleckstrin-like domain
MKCPTCSTNVPDDAVFCPKCGARLRKGNDAASAENVPEIAPAVGASAQQAPVQSAPTTPGKERFQSAAVPRRVTGDVPEEELWTGGYSPKAMYGQWISAAVVTIAGLVVVLLFANNGVGWSVLGAGVLVVWGGLVLSLVYRRMGVKYRMTSLRLFQEKGILRRVTDRIEMIDIDDVTVEQGLLERMFGVGTIRITSSDRTSPELAMPGIDDVKNIADLIDQSRRRERERRGMFIESV